MARSRVRHPFDFESKVRGRKSEANNFRCKRELVATGNQVMVGIAAKQRLSLFVETQMDRVRGLPCLALLEHDPTSLSLVWKTAAAPCTVNIASNLRAIGVFSLFFM
jgi:hypothetical protein